MGHIAFGLKLKFVNLMKRTLRDLALVCLSRLTSDNSNLPSGHTGPVWTSSNVPCLLLLQGSHVLQFSRVLLTTPLSSFILLSLLLTFGSIAEFSYSQENHHQIGFPYFVVSSHMTQPFSCKIGVIKYTHTRKYMNMSLTKM